MPWDVDLVLGKNWGGCGDPDPRRNCPCRSVFCHDEEYKQGIVSGGNNLVNKVLGDVNAMNLVKRYEFELMQTELTSEVMDPWVDALYDLLSDETVEEITRWRGFSNQMSEAQYWAQRPFIKTWVINRRNYLLPKVVIAEPVRNLAHEVSSGNFREDLYYRLNVVELLLPPLRERGEDIVLLANFFLQQFSRKYQKENLALSTADVNLITAYHWPGNVRELRNFMERAVILSAGARLELTHPIERQGSLETMFSDLPTLDEMQRQYIQHVLQKTGGRIGGPGGAAEILGMKRTTLNSRMKQLGLK